MVDSPTREIVYYYKKPDVQTPNVQGNCLFLQNVNDVYLMPLSKIEVKTGVIVEFQEKSSSCAFIHSQYIKMEDCFKFTNTETKQDANTNRNIKFIVKTGKTKKQTGYKDGPTKLAHDKTTTPNTTITPTLVQPNQMVIAKEETNTQSLNVGILGATFTNCINEIYACLFNKTKIAFKFPARSILIKLYVISNAKNVIFQQKIYDGFYCKFPYFFFIEKPVVIFSANQTNCKIKYVILFRNSYKILQQFYYSKVNDRYYKSSINKTMGILKSKSNLLIIYHTDFKYIQHYIPNFNNFTCIEKDTILNMPINIEFNLF